MSTKRYAYRAYPTPGQVRNLSRLFGCVRVVFNDFVAERRRQHKSDLAFEPSGELVKRVTVEAKATPEREWLSSVSAVALQQSVRDADQAYRNFFASISGKRKGPKVGAPKFKSRRGRQSARFTRAARFTVEQTTHGVGFVTLPKVGRIRFALSRLLPSDPSSVTVIRNSDGTYEVSFVVDVPARPKTEPLHSGRVAGVDVGCVSYATVVYSDGTREKIDNPRYLRAALRRLARAQKSLARKVKGSTNREKQRVKVAKLHSHVARQRLDHAHQVASRLVRENQTISIETLNITSMVRKPKPGDKAPRLGRPISDAGMGQFLRILEEKTTDHGRVLVKAAQDYPSTRMCSICGFVADEIPLSTRRWSCPGCGAHLDRDYNAAVNMLTLADGQPESLNACGGRGRLRLAGAPARETGTHPNGVAA